MFFRYNKFLDTDELKIALIYGPERFPGLSKNGSLDSALTGAHRGTLTHVTAFLQTGLFFCLLSPQSPCL